jgi:hypothetical protein
VSIPDLVLNLQPLFYATRYAREIPKLRLAVLPTRGPNGWRDVLGLNSLVLAFTVVGYEPRSPWRGSVLALECRSGAHKQLAVDTREIRASLIADWGAAVPSTPR